MRIAILQTDHVREEVQPQFGDYPEMFERFFKAHPTLQIEVVNFDVREQLPASIDCDAYLITGSRYSVYEPLPWMPPLVEFLANVLDAGRKIIGICFGHQLMAHFFGGQTGRADAGWGVGVHVTDIVTEAPWMEPRLPHLGLLCSHQDQVLALPQGAELYASSAFCPLAGFTWRDQVITIQGHPEFTKDYSQALMTLRRDLLGEAVYENGCASLSLDTHEAVLLTWIINFVSRDVALEEESTIVSSA